jgi:tetratricopeptide (TPR) repeat protein
LIVLHDKAKKDLDALSDFVEQAPDSLKAKYLNNYGVYHSHEGDLANALNYYKEAMIFSPHNHKIITNYLLTEFEYYRRTDRFEKAKHKDWIDRLENVLAEHPDFHPAIRTKAYFIGETVSANEAEEYLLNTKTWEAEPLESRICMAEIYMREGDFDRARDLLKDKEDKDSFALYALLGFINLTLSTGISRKDKEFYITGAGPSSINYGLLREAEKNYRKSYEILLRLGLPRLSEEIIVNFSTVLHLLFKHDESLRICKSLLDLHPENLLIQGPMAQSYLGVGIPEKAIPFAQKAFEINPNTTTLKNYCICLFEAEDHETVISVISKHIGKEIIEHEKGIFMSLLALSYNEIGEDSKSREIIESMKMSDNLAGEAISAEAAIVRKNGLSREEALRYFKEGKEKYSENMILLTNYAAALNPSGRDEAGEIVYCLERISRIRGLYPEEYNAFSRAYLTLNNTDKSLEIIYKAYRHFPENVRILYELAISLSASGNEEDAYNVLKIYLSKSSANYTQIRNLAFLAYNTGRIEEAISLLQKALGKTTDIKERGEIHCHLFELKKMEGRPPRELLHHVHEFGKTVGEDKNLEARYLSMILLATLNYTAEDDESKGWLETAKERLTLFSERNPRNPFLKPVKLDMTIPEQERGRDILSTLMAELLPHTLRTEKLRIAGRGVAFPLAFRSTYLGGSSIFEYYSSSAKSEEKENYFHIWNGNNNLDVENDVARNAKRVCIDISAMLTLAGFDLLEILQEFELIIIAGGTKHLINREYAGMHPPHDLAQKVEKWRLDNKRKIRVRNIGEDPSEHSEVSDDAFYGATEAGIFIKRDMPLQETIGSGMGESILIAQQLSIPLYSDDSTVRLWASQEYSVSTFSTLSLINALIEKRNIRTEGASEIFARMIKSNYVIIPFEPRHLTAALLQVLKKHGDRLHRRDDLMSDEILGTLMRQFGDPSLNYIALLNIASDWWLSILEDTNVPDDILVECMEPVSYALSMHSVSGIVKGVAKTEQETRLSGIWLRLIVKTVNRRKDLVSEVWSAVKTVCERIYTREPAKYEKIIYDEIPRLLIKSLEQDTALIKNQKIELVVNFTQNLPSPDRERIESHIRKENPNFMY